MGGTNLSDQSITNGGTFNTYLTNDSGHAILVRCATANIPSAKAGFAVGCQLEDTTTGIWYDNTGTTASCTFTKASIVATGNKGYYAVSIPVTGTTQANVFAATIPFGAVITNILVTAVGATAQTITVGQTAGDFGTSTTGTTAGSVSGLGVAIANATVASGATVQAVSTSAVDTSIVTITFTTT